MLTKTILWSALFIPWLTLIFLRKETVKRYFPVSVFTSLLVTVVFEIAYALDWWKLTASVVPWGNITNVPFVYGVFFIGTLWIFHLTFRRFWLYMLTNLVIDALQIFVASRFLFEGWIYDLHKINEFQVFLIMTGLSLVIYVYQIWQEGILQTPVEGDKPKPEMELNWSLTSKNREGAR